MKTLLIHALMEEEIIVVNLEISNSEIMQEKKKHILILADQDYVF